MPNLSEKRIEELQDIDEEFFSDKSQQDIEGLIALGEFVRKYSEAEKLLTRLGEATQKEAKYCQHCGEKL